MVVTIRKRIISIALAILVVAAFIPFTAMESNAYKAGSYWLLTAGAVPAELQEGATKLVDIKVFNHPEPGTYSIDYYKTESERSWNNIYNTYKETGISHMFSTGTLGKGYLIVLAKDDKGGIYTNSNATISGTTITAAIDKSLGYYNTWNANSDEGVRPFTVSYIAQELSIKKEVSKGGKVTSRDNMLNTEGKFTFTVKADTGYVLDNLCVKDNNGEVVPYVNDGMGNCYIKNLDRDITIYASFKGHTHGNFSITGEGNTLVAKCGNATCDLPCSLTCGEIAIEMDIKDKVFDGESCEAVLDAADISKWKECLGDAMAPKVKYVGRNSTVYDSNVAPSEIGDYTAILYVPSVGTKSRYVAKDDFSITKPVSHTHGNFSIIGEGNTLVAKCGNGTCDLPCTLTCGEIAIEMDIKDKEFDGESCGATLNAADISKWKECLGDAMAPTVKYVGRNSTVYDSNVAPSEIGDYTAILYVPSVGTKSRYVAKDDFSITKPVSPVIKFSSVTGSKKAFTAKWTVKNCTGYQIRYSLKSSMGSSKTVTLNKASYKSKKIIGLKKGKKYYVQIRTYTEVAGKTFYSSWSSKKSVTV